MAKFKVENYILAEVDYEPMNKNKHPLKCTYVGKIGSTSYGFNNTIYYPKESYFTRIKIIGKINHVCTALAEKFILRKLSKKEIQFYKVMYGKI